MSHHYKKNSDVYLNILDKIRIENKSESCFVNRVYDFLFTIHKDILKKTKTLDGTK